MTILDCSVTGCMYNEANCCHKGNIKVEGEDAKKVKIPAAEVLRNVGTDAQKT